MTELLYGVLSELTEPLFSFENIMTYQEAKTALDDFSQIELIAIAGYWNDQFDLKEAIAVAHCDRTVFIRKSAILTLIIDALLEKENKLDRVLSKISVW